MEETFAAFQPSQANELFFCVASESVLGSTRLPAHRLEPKPGRRSSSCRCREKRTSLGRNGQARLLAKLANQIKASRRLGGRASEQKQCTPFRLRKQRCHLVGRAEGAGCVCSSALQKCEEKPAWKAAKEKRPHQEPPRRYKMLLAERGRFRAASSLAAL